MEVVKRKILLENSVDRNYNSPTYGVMTASTFYINVFLTQNIDDMGLFTDMSYIKKGNTPADNSILSQKLIADGYFFPFMSGGTPVNAFTVTNIVDKNEKYTLRVTGQTENFFFTIPNLKITGFTNSKLEDVKSYNRLTPYIENFDIKKETYTNYLGTTINGVNRITYLGEPTIYVFDTNNDNTIGTASQITGIQYKDYTGQTRSVLDANNNIKNIPVTEFNYMSEGWNETNTSLSALTKEEYLFGIISVPEIQNDVFIDRGKTTVFEKHLKLSGIKNINELVRYGNGYFNINRL